VLLIVNTVPVICCIDFVPELAQYDLGSAKSQERMGDINEL